MSISDDEVEAALAFWCTKLPKAQREQPIPQLLRDHMRGTLEAAAKVRAIRGDGEWVSQLERYEQFTDGWGDEVIGLKQHPKGDYVKFADVVAALAATPAATGGEKE